MLNQLAALAMATAVTAVPPPSQDTIRLAAPQGARLEVQNRSGSIHVEGAPGDQVVAWTTGAADTALRVQQSGSVIRISVSEHWRRDVPRPPAARRPPSPPAAETVPRRGAPDPDPDPDPQVDGRGDERRVDLRVRVPRDVRLSVRGVQTEIRVDSVQGPIEVEGVTESVRLAGIRGLVDVNTVEGDLRLDGITGELRAQSVAGDVILRDVESDLVRANTMEGDVRFHGTIRDGGDYEFTTHFGSVWMAVPPEASAAFDVNVRSGGIDTGFGLPGMETGALGNTYRFVLGEGAARVEIRTFQGDVYLRRPGQMSDRSARDRDGSGR